MPYDRSNPSPRYQTLASMYEQLHREGDAARGIPAQNMFPGASLRPHIARIRRVIEETGARTVLDYGAGKGHQYRPQPIVVDGAHVADSVAEYWDLDELRCYDPGYPPHAVLPEGRFDGVVSTDVLEHCPEEDLPWIVDEILGFATRFAYLNVACFAAQKVLPNGENAHVTIRPPHWWRDLVRARAAAYPGLLWELHTTEKDGTRIVETLCRNGEIAPATLPLRKHAAESQVAKVTLDGCEARFLVPNDAARWRVETLFTKEPVTIDWLRAMPRGATFLDVGANVGMYTVFAGVVRGARVVAFEPESGNYALLNANIRENGLADRVTAYCAGLCDRAGVDRLYLGDLFAGGSAHSLGAEVGPDLRARPASFVQGAISLCYDDLVAAGEAPVPACVKIDVDGFEHRVLRGMARTLRSPELRTLIVELDAGLAEHREIRDWLAAAGFRWDPQQVARSTRKDGPFAGVAEHVFER